MREIVKTLGLAGLCVLLYLLFTTAAIWSLWDEPPQPAKHTTPGCP